MSTFRAPGVYVIEDPAPSAHHGVVPTGVPCFFGFAQHGPALVPQRITGMDEFHQLFGPRPTNLGVFPHAYLEASVYAFFLNGGGECYVCRINEGERARWSLPSFEVLATSGGTWANDLRVRVLEAPSSSTGKDGRTVDLSVLEAVPPETEGEPISYRVVEAYEGLSLDPEDPRYLLAAEGPVNGVSTRIELRSEGGAPSPNKTSDPGAGSNGVAPSTPGRDEAGSLAAYEQGLRLLADQPDVSLIACPDAYPAGEATDLAAVEPILRAAIDHAEEHRSMVVLDAPPQPPARELGDLAERARELVPFADRFRSSSAAIYAPWFEAPDLDPDSEQKTIVVPPCGFILGAYNRSDAHVGVWKAPANMPVLGALALQLNFTEEQSEVLNPEGVNLVRTFPGQGMLIWGARTSTRDLTWRYVNVRRLQQYVERTLGRQTEAAIFEPNDPSTWNAQVRSAESFLRSLWQQGGLMGGSPDEAYQVTCGVPQTMTMGDVANGLLKLEVKIAPVRPAEFVVLTLSRLLQTPSP